MNSKIRIITRVNTCPVCRGEIRQNRGITLITPIREILYCGLRCMKRENRSK